MRGLTTEINEKDIMKNPSFQVWIAAMGAVLFSALAFTAFAYTTFQTKDEAKGDKGDILHQLDRIENKVDQLHGNR
jgi:hypothetical protein